MQRCGVTKSAGKTTNPKLCIMNAWKTFRIRLHVQYSLPDDERKMFETCRRHEELNQNINLKGAFCWLTLRSTTEITQSYKSTDYTADRGSKT